MYHMYKRVKIDVSISEINIDSQTIEPILKWFYKKIVPN